MKKLVNIIGIISVLALLVSAYAIINQPSETLIESNVLDDIRLNGKMDVCYVNYPPFSYKNLETMEMEGIGVDIIETIAQKSGFSVNYIETTWANVVLDLKSNRCQANISGIFPLIERSYAGVMFSDSFGYLGNNGVVKKEDNRFSSLDELNNENITIAVIDGEQGYEYAKKYLTKANLHVISSGDISLAFVEVSSGRADVGLGDSIVVEQYLMEHNEVKPLLTEPYLLRDLTFAVSENNLKLLNFFNNAINVLSTSGELSEIYSQYPFKSVVMRQN